MIWFRFYHDALHDPKVQRLDAVTFRHWVNLLCLASMSKPRGQLPSVGDIAFELRIGEAEADRLLDDLVSRELLDATPDGYAPHNWNGRQFKSDDVGDRVANWRAGGGNKGATPPATLPETPDVTPPQRRGNVASNDVVTLHVTPPDTDPETETDPERQIQSGRETTRARPREVVKPSPFPSVDDLCAMAAAVAESQHIAPAALHRDVLRFRNDCIKRRVRYDSPEEWRAAVENWVTNPDFGPGARSPTGADEGDAAAVGRAAEERAAATDASLTRAREAAAVRQGRLAAIGVSEEEQSRWARVVQAAPVLPTLFRTALFRPQRGEEGAAVIFPTRAECERALGPAHAATRQTIARRLAAGERARPDGQAAAAVRYLAYEDVLPVLDGGAE